MKPTTQSSYKRYSRRNACNINAVYELSKEKLERDNTIKMIIEQEEDMRKEMLKILDRQKLQEASNNNDFNSDDVNIDSDICKRDKDKPLLVAWTGEIVRGYDKNTFKLDQSVILPLLPFDIEKAKLVVYEYDGNKSHNVFNLWERYQKRFDEGTDWKFSKLEHDGSDVDYDHFKAAIKTTYVYSPLGKDEPYCCHNKLKSFLSLLVEQEHYDCASQWEYYRQLLCRSHKPRDLYKAGILTFSECNMASKIYKMYNGNSV